MMINLWSSSWLLISVISSNLRQFLLTSNHELQAVGLTVHQQCSISRFCPQTGKETPRQETSRMSSWRWSTVQFHGEKNQKCGLPGGVRVVGLMVKTHQPNIGSECVYSVRENSARSRKSAWCFDLEGGKGENDVWEWPRQHHISHMLQENGQIRFCSFPTTETRILVHEVKNGFYPWLTRWTSR